MSDTPDLPLPDAWKRLVKGGAMPPEIPMGSPVILQAPGLVSKLAEIMSVIERIPKRGHNQHFNYDFATESDITSEIRQRMAERSLMLIPDVQSVTWRDAQTKSGIQSVCCLMVRFTVYDGQSGETLSFVVPGEGQDSGDKCVPKAMTSALKYALLKTFMIPTGDDPERDHEAPKPSGGRAPRASKSAIGPDPVTHVQHPVPPSARATIPEGCALVLEVQAGQWGKAVGQVLLLDAAGVEHKYAVFDKELVIAAQTACTAGFLVTPTFATPQPGGKTDLKGLRREDVL